MKIKPKNLLDTTDAIEAEKARARQVKKDTASQTAQASQILKDDKVEVSSLAKFLSADLDPAVIAQEREAKKAALKAQIDAGDYKVDSDKLARAVYERLEDEISSA